MGLFFGILLDKGGLTDYNKILGQFLFQDFTLLKVLLSAIVTGNIGLFFLESKGWIEKNIKPFKAIPVILGGLLFGFGFGLLGFCIANSVAALATGALHALSGILGVLAGAFLFSAIYPKLPVFLKVDKGRKLTLEDVTSLPSWAITALVIIVFGLSVYMIEVFMF